MPGNVSRCTTMQHALALLQGDGVVVPRRRARHDGGGEVEDVLASGMARAVVREDVAAVAALLLRGVRAAALDMCAADSLPCTCAAAAPYARVRRRGERPLLLALVRNNSPEVTELLLAAGAAQRRMAAPRLLGGGEETPHGRSSSCAAC